MGYYTSFDLTWQSRNKSKELDDRIIKAFGELPYWKDGGYSADLGDEIYMDDVKWYDHMDDMYSLSKMFPEVLFHLSGDGEDKEDLWEEHWKNGAVQQCMFTIPPYNPNLMEEYKPRNCSPDRREIEQIQIIF